MYRNDICYFNLVNQILQNIFEKGNGKKQRNHTKVIMLFRNWR